MLADEKTKATERECAPPPSLLFSGADQTERFTSTLVRHWANSDSVTGAADM
jgi:hypothetical protein